MIKNKLNNLLSFKDFTQYPNLLKKTKRTDIGGDVINEHFFDKLIYAVSNDTDMDKNIEEFKNRLVKAAKSGQVSDLKIDDNIYTFKILDKIFKINCGDKCTASFKTPKNKKEWTKFDLSKDIADKIANSLEDIDYID